MTSKLDPHRKARDHRKDDRERKKRKRHREEKPTVHVDVTSVIFTSQQPDAESRIVVLDALPDMEDVWIDKVVYLRQPGSGAPDRAFIGTQYLDDSLAWIELTLATPAVGGSSAPDPGDPSVATFVRRFGAASLGSVGDEEQVGIDKTTDNLHLWISDPLNDRIVRFNVATGAFELASSGVTMVIPRGLIVHPSDGFIYVADVNTSGGGLSRVRVITASTGVFSSNIRQTTQWEGDLELLSGISLNPAGTELIVCVPRSHDNASDPAGEMHRHNISTTALTRTQDSTYYPYPNAVDVDASGNWYIASAGTGDFPEGHRVTKTSSVGVTQNSVGGFAGTASGRFNNPNGVYVDTANSRVFVSDNQNHRVQIFDTDLNYIGKFGTYGNGSGELAYPAGMTMIGTSLFVVCNGIGSESISLTEWTITL